MRTVVLLSLAAAIAQGGVLESVMTQLSHGSEAGAIRELASARTSSGVTPEYLEAMSWLARAELINHRYPQAEQFAQQTYNLSIAQLKTRPLDREPHLPIALGAAIEVEAGILAETGRRSEAIAYLQDQMKQFAATSIRARIQKNVLLLTLEGKPAPPLEGVVLPKGKPILLFFWAHWCADCKDEIPALTMIKSEFEAKGLGLMGLTQRYGYVANGIEAPPAAENAYIEKVRRALYGNLLSTPSPISEINLTRYGASTIPTLVLIDRAGIVRLYHPGAIGYPELRAAVARVIS